MITLGLCEGRHNIENVTDYIFPAAFFATSEDMFDFKRMQEQIKKVFDEFSRYEEIDIYITGYTPALVEVINYILKNNFKYVYLFHYNKDSNDYEEQPLFTY